jgi:hypothetical protein
VPILVLDPIVLVNTRRLPYGSSAKLLTLLALGRTNGYLNEGADAEAQLLRQLLPPPPVDLAQGWTRINGDAAYEDTFEKRKLLMDAIPPGGQSIEWGLAVSTQLIVRVIRRVGKLRYEQGLKLEAGAAVAGATSHTFRGVWESWKTVPDYTGSGDEDANITIHTALRTGAPMVVTKLAAACERESPRRYDSTDDGQSYPLGSTYAIHFDDLVQALRDEFDFDGIDASVLLRIAPEGPDRPSC